MRSVGPRVFFFSVAVLLLGGAGGAGAAASPVAKSGAAPIGLEKRVGTAAKYVPGELIVQFRTGVSASARSSALGASDARATRGLDQVGLVLVRLKKGVSVQAAAAELESDPRVMFAEPNYVYHLSAIPNDPRFPQLWGMHQGSDHDIDAPQAWNLTTGRVGVRVAVIDSGIAYDHPDLAGNIWVNNDPPDGVDNDGNGKRDDTRGWDFVGDDNQPLDHNGHGTHVAGTIGAVGDNALGVTGVSWDVSLMPLRAADGHGRLTAANIRQAVAYACAERAHIVNGSFGGPGKSRALANLIKSAACRRTLFIFAAGNDGTNLTANRRATNSYPCEYHRPAPQGFSVKNIVCVAATTRADRLASYSNHGPAAVHLAAPGGNGGADSQEIRSTWPGYQVVWGPDDMGTVGTWGDQINAGANGAAAPLWDRTNAHSSSPTSSLTDSPAGNYVNSAITTIRNMTAINLTGQFGCAIDYDLLLDTELFFDFFGIFAGTSTLTEDEEIEALSGSSGGQFVMLTSDLTSFDGAPEVYVRFFLDSDRSIREDGAYVDDVLVKCVAANGEGYETISGTSMATPHVAGVAALLKAKVPGFSVTKLKNAILQGVEKKRNLRNRVSTGGRLNARRSLNVALDHTRPRTTITAKPSNRTTSHRATFRFRSNESGSRFQCKHMSGAWKSCSSPKTYRGLDEGLHRFRVRAIDKAGNVDRTPAQDSWRIV
jgi:subtilisin family serine protease